MAYITSIETPEEHKYIVVGKVHIAQILHKTIFKVLLRNVTCTCQVHHFESINDIKVRLESQLNLG